MSTWRLTERFETNFVDLHGAVGLLVQAPGRTKGSVRVWSTRGQVWKDAVQIVPMGPCASYRPRCARRCVLARLEAHPSQAHSTTLKLRRTKSRHQASSPKTIIASDQDRPAGGSTAPSTLQPLDNFIGTLKFGEPNTATRGVEGRDCVIAEVATYQVCGIDIAATAPDMARDLVVRAAAEGHPMQVHLCNAYTLSLVRGDKRLQAALNASHLNLPDGAPVAWLGRSAGNTTPVRGPQLLEDVVISGQASGLRHYFYGGAPGVVEDVVHELQRRAPDLRISGKETPDYTELSDSEVSRLAHRIAQTDTNVVWIGLGTPKQDYLVSRLADLVPSVVIPVGAAFDFVAGRVAQAPRRLQGTGLEWSYRLAQEPKRLWRRYLIGNPRFIIHAVMSRRRP